MIRVTVTPSELRLILLIEHESAEAEGELHFSAADLLTHRALVLRATAP